VYSLPRLLLRVEGFALAAAGLTVYFHFDYGWALLVVLALAPDLSMLAYLVDTRVGATAYNLAHTEVLPALLVVVGVLADEDVLVQLALIWLVHIGVDRTLGYGLKYPTRFDDTHLQRV
jgi:hypothetical protein